jgi:hypothetical protein
VAYTNLDTEDEINGYEVDIFVDPLQDSKAKMQATSVVRFALDIRRRDLGSFCEHYGQVLDAVGNTPESAEVAVQKTYELHRRFAGEVIEVMASQHQEHWERWAGGELPETCLLVLAGPASGELIWTVVKEAEDLTRELQDCPTGESKALEDICEKVLEFLF